VYSCAIATLLITGRGFKNPHRGQLDFKNYIYILIITLNNWTTDGNKALSLETYSNKKYKVLSMQEREKVGIYCF